jgi:hypothetical protein
MVSRGKQPVDKPPRLHSQHLQKYGATTAVRRGQLREDGRDLLARATPVSKAGCVSLAQKKRPENNDATPHDET